MSTLSHRHTGVCVCGHSPWQHNTIGEFFYSIRHQHKLRKLFEDCLKESLVACHVENPDWGTTDCGRNKWRNTVHDAPKIFEEYWNVKRDARKEENHWSINSHVTNMAEYVSLLQASLATRVRLLDISQITTNTALG